MPLNLYRRVFASEFNEHLQVPMSNKLSAHFSHHPRLMVSLKCGCKKKVEILISAGCMLVRPGTKDQVLSVCMIVRNTSEVFFQLGSNQVGSRALWSFWLCLSKHLRLARWRAHSPDEVVLLVEIKDLDFQNMIILFTRNPTSSVVFKASPTH